MAPVTKTLPLITIWKTNLVTNELIPCRYLRILFGKFSVSGISIGIQVYWNWMNASYSCHLYTQMWLLSLHTSTWIQSPSEWIHSVLVSVMIIKLICIWLLWLFALLLLSMNFSQCQSSEITVFFRQSQEACSKHCHRK